MNIKEETIEMLRILKAQSYPISVNADKAAVVIEDVSMESFLWVINQAIAQIKDGKPDWRDN